jgi:superfamily II DNA/RNA helicase
MDIIQSYTQKIDEALRAGNTEGAAIYKDLYKDLLEQQEETKRLEKKEEEETKRKKEEAETKRLEKKEEEETKRLEKKEEEETKRLEIRLRYESRGDTKKKKLTGKPHLQNDFQFGAFAWLPSSLRWFSLPSAVSSQTSYQYQPESTLQEVFCTKYGNSQNSCKNQGTLRQRKKVGTLS